MKTKILIICMLCICFNPCFPQGFTISGSQLLDANGSNFIMNGITVPLAWFAGDVNANISNIRNNMNANCLRIVVSATTSNTDWHRCVEYCINNKMVPMVELHDVTCSTSTSRLQDMANWWAGKASYLKSPGIARYILINIANEWGDWQMANSSPTTWRDAYKDAIDTIRNAGITTTIVIDAPNCGQDIQTNTITSYAGELMDYDPEHNLLFSVHTYCEWGVNGSSSISTDLPAIKNAGIPIIVGEFGFQHTEGTNTCDINESLLLSTCKNSGIGWLAWSLKGNSEVVQYLDMSNDWAASDLTSWGNSVINSPDGLRNSARIASVFAGDSGCIPTAIVPFIKVNEGEMIQDSVTSLNVGDTVMLSPQPSDTGSWQWTGPEGFIGNEREVVLNAIQTNQAGYYVMHYTDTNNCISSGTIQLTVNGCVAGDDSVEINGIYKISLKHSGYSMGVSDASTEEGASILQESYDTIASQQWIVRDVGNGNIKIISLGTTKALSVHGRSIADYINIEQRSYEETNDQKWQLVSDGAGYFQIRNSGSHKCLDVKGASTDEDTTLIQWTCGTFDNQKFSFTKLGTAPDNLKDPNELKGFSIFPNPSGDGKFIITADEIVDKSRLLIFNMRGELVYEQVLYEKRTVIDTKLNHGIYIIKVIDRQFTPVQKLIIS